MSTNPISFRTPFESQMSKLPPEHQHILRTVWNAVTDLQTSIPIIMGHINTNKTAIATTNETINSTSTSQTIINTGGTTGFVSNQIGLATYSTQQSDYGAVILLGDAAPIAVTMSEGPGIQLPWIATFLNTDVGLATLTPVTSTITYSGNPAAASLDLPQWAAAIVVYDGTDFWAVVIPIGPQNTPAVAHEWLDSFDSSTGVFGQTRPDFTDLSGQIDTATQMPDSGVTAGTYAQATITVDAEGLVTSASSATAGFSGTIVTAQLTPTGAQGSMTFLDGRITAQTPAT